jgi:NADH:ubiquinone reductase (H+-translocating)
LSNETFRNENLNIKGIKMAEAKNTTAKIRPRVVTIGAGFAGLNAARAFNHHSVDVLLVDRENYHTFTPLLYQVAAAEIEPEEIAFPIRTIFRNKSNVNFLLGEITDIDFDHSIVTVGGIVTPYDYLILAAGSVSHFFGIPGAAEYSYPLKDMTQAIALRNHILSSFEYAAHENNLSSIERLLTFVVVGGGPTGVEFAGALIELIRGPLRRDFHQLDSRQARVILVEAAEALLPNFPEKLREYSRKRLMNMGVEILLHSTVSALDNEGLHLKDGRLIESDTIIWTAGVEGHPIGRSWVLPMARNNTIDVESTLQVTGYSNVYVVGDLAQVRSDGKSLPMLAPVAIQEGRTAAQNILRQLDGKATSPFHYKDRGILATIGRNKAVAQFGNWTFTGYPAWILWVIVHLAQLIGFRNRILVLINWFWDYLFFERAVRLILPRGLLRKQQPRQLIADSRKTVEKHIQ